MPPADVPLSAPVSVGAVLEELSAGNAMVVAGGTSMAMLLKNGLVAPDRLVSLRRVAGLAVIEQRGMQLHLGATVTLRQLAAAPLIRATAPALAYAATRVGNPRVRSVATIGGSIAHADPRQDIPPVLLALGAHACLSGPDGRRTVPLPEYFLGFLETAVREDELITEVVVPVPPGLTSVYVRFTPNSRDDYPVAGVAVAASTAADGSVSAARIAVGGLGARAALVTPAADMLVGQRPERDVLAAVAALAAASVEPSTDRRGSADYKRAMTEVWVRRALEQCLAGQGPIRPAGRAR